MIPASNQPKSVMKGVCESRPEPLCRVVSTSNASRTQTEVRNTSSRHPTSTMIFACFFSTTTTATNRVQSRNAALALHWLVAALIRYDGYSLDALSGDREHEQVQTSGTGKGKVGQPCHYCLQLDVNWHGEHEGQLPSSEKPRQDCREALLVDTSTTRSSIALPSLFPVCYTVQRVRLESRTIF